MSEGTNKESIFKKLLPPGRLGGGFSFFIAKRYILSKKSTNAINIISGISMVGLAIATMAMVIVLSVFNGFHDMVASLLTNFDPQLEIIANEGKSFAADDPNIQKVKKLSYVDVATECVTDMALAMNYDQQAMITVKGVEDNYELQTNINDILEGDSDFTLHSAYDQQFGIPGIHLAQILSPDGIWSPRLKLYAPQREGQLESIDDEGFVTDSLLAPKSVFMVGQGKYDKTTMLTSIEFARRLFCMQGEITSLEVRLKEGKSLSSAKSEIKKIVGEKFIVKDRYEQQADTFKIMQIEKVLAYVFLTFILIVACFNIISSISMLVIDKKDDIATLRNLGASDKQISHIFLFEGRLISVIGAIIGVIMGLALCWLQEQYGLVTMGNGGNYLVQAYPVSVHAMDILIIFLTVIAVGWIAVWYPIKKTL